MNARVCRAGCSSSKITKSTDYLPISESRSLIGLPTPPTASLACTATTHKPNGLIATFATVCELNVSSNQCDSTHQLSIYSSAGDCNTSSCSAWTTSPSIEERIHCFSGPAGAGAAPAAPTGGWAFNGVPLVAAMWAAPAVADTLTITTTVMA